MAHTRFGESEYETEAQAGANSLNRISSESDRLYSENAEQRHAAQVEAYHIAAERIRQAREDRQFAHDMALAKHKEEMEREGAAALKKMSAVQMDQPGAMEHLQKIQEEHPAAFIGPGSIQPIYKDYFDRGMAYKSAQDARDQRSQEAAQVRQEKAAAKLTEDTAKGDAKKAADDEKRQNLLQRQAQLLELNHQTKKETLATKLKEIRDKNPDWLNTTGLYTDAKGVQRFGQKDKQSDDASTVAKPDDVEAYKEYQTLKSDFEHHTKALDAIRDAQLKAISGEVEKIPATPVAKTPDTVNTVPPITDGGVAVAPEVPAPGVSGGAEAVVNPNLSPVAPATSAPTEPVAAPNPHHAALDWATKNPDDPRSAAILKTAKAFVP